MHIVLTGASSGIGESMARHFGAQEHDLTLIARREARLQTIAGELAGKTHVLPADLSDLSICDELIATAAGALGPIDVLINNAGIQYVEPTVGVSAERVDRIVNVDLTAPLHLTRAVLPSMLGRQRGVIVNIASMASISHTPGMCYYNAVKAGLAAASESLRVELAGTGVHVVTVYPGPVTSPMEDAARSQYQPSFATRAVPTGQPEELARLIDNAIKRRRPRVIYPRVYGLARYFRVIAQWVTDKATPPLALPE